jgi:transposase
MKQRASSRAFKRYDQHQLSAFPLDLNNLISDNHIVRSISEIIDNLDLSAILSKYPKMGAACYHPRMLVKLLVYGYVNNIYSSRQLEEVCKRDIHFLWLTAMSQPDHNTIARFRSNRLTEDGIKPIFKQVVLFLAEAGEVHLKEVYTDGTKIESRANKYTFVWDRAIKTSKERMLKQLDELWEYASHVNKEELQAKPKLNPEGLKPEDIKQAIQQINEAIKDKEVDPKVKQKLSYGEKKWPEALQKYEQQQEQMKGRNSMSKTDPDATFMRMKEDHMLNGQLKPGYNLQISTSNQYMVFLSLHQTTNDTTTLIPHLDGYHQLYGHMPQAVTADAGYGSNENYSFCEQQQITPYIKYNYFHKEQTKQWATDPFKTHNLVFDQINNCFYCPSGQPMQWIGEKIEPSDNGFEKKIDIYQATACQGCELRKSCFKGTNYRRIEVNHELRRQKEMVKELLNSPEGIKHRKKRPADVEAVFGQIKHNNQYKRFRLNGISKNTVDLNLVGIAHNLKKFLVKQKARKMAA